ncbi:MAG: hypothetical protein PHF63_04690 [Herbinix sp.]|nr:hypothetical protein [Herbinix sp.]
MAKAGMRRPNIAEPHGTEGSKRMHTQKNVTPPVPEIQGRAKAGHESANPYEVPNHEPKG